MIVDYKKKLENKKQKQDEKLLEQQTFAAEQRVKGFKANKQIRARFEKDNQN